MSNKVYFTSMGSPGRPATIRPNSQPVEVFDTWRGFEAWRAKNEAEIPPAEPQFPLNWLESITTNDTVKFWYYLESKGFGKFDPNWTKPDGMPDPRPTPIHRDEFAMRQIEIPPAVKIQYVLMPKRRFWRVASFLTVAAATGFLIAVPHALAHHPALRMFTIAGGLTNIALRIVQNRIAACVHRHLQNIAKH